jgi:O-antigen ligase
MACAVVIVAAVFNIQIELGRSSGRAISTDEFAIGIESIFGEGENEGGRIGTREFRLEWWGAIWDYTVEGPYFLSGKGFGVNLADSDGFQVLEDESLRAPHNSHMTVLARMGVPGFAIWLALQLTFAFKLMTTWRRANAMGLRGWAALDVWIFVYWLAMIINACFDPYLEGPQGGIWFWSVFGLGLYSIRRQERLFEGGGGPGPRLPSRVARAEPQPITPLVLDSRSRAHGKSYQ